MPFIGSRSQLLDRTPRLRAVADRARFAGDAARAAGARLDGAGVARPAFEGAVAAGARLDELSRAARHRAGGADVTEAFSALADAAGSAGMADDGTPCAARVDVAAWAVAVQAA